MFPHFDYQPTEKDLEDYRKHLQEDILIIYRNYSRISENDDYILNVLPRLGSLTESIELRDIEGGLVGWKIQYRYE